MNVQSVLTRKISVHFYFKFTKLFLFGCKKFWITTLLDKCYGAFVFVYDQNYAVVIVNQPKREECYI